MKLYLNFERVLSPAETDVLRELVKRRGQREPLQHIIGSTSFCGHEIAVNRHALVPRPETELLAELVGNFSTNFRRDEFHESQFKMMGTRRVVPPSCGFRHRHRLHRHRARGKMSKCENHRNGYFGGRIGVGEKKCSAKPSRGTD